MHGGTQIDKQTGTSTDTQNNLQAGSQRDKLTQRRRQTDSQRDKQI